MKERGEQAPETKSLVKRPAFWGFLLLALLTAWLGGRYLFLVPATCEAIADPPALVPADPAEAMVHLELYGRAGLRIPLDAPKLRCAVDEGRHLVSWRYNADSTAVLVRSVAGEGVVLLRLRTAAWPFPVYLGIRIEYPRA